MPRYKLSPEGRALEQERKENLRNIMKGLDVKNFDDLKDVFKMMVGEMLENGLDGELDDELGYTKYDYRNKEGNNSRNGYPKKTLKTSFGETEIKVPRDRDGEFEPQLVKKNQTTLTGDIEEKIISMYAKGMTTSDIEAHIRDIYGLECSDTTISTVIAANSALVTGLSSCISPFSSPVIMPSVCRSKTTSSKVVFANTTAFIDITAIIKLKITAVNLHFFIIKVTLLLVSRIPVSIYHSVYSYIIPCLSCNMQ